MKGYVNNIQLQTTSINNVEEQMFVYV